MIFGDQLFLGLALLPALFWIIDGGGVSRLLQWKWTLVLWELGVGVIFLCVLVVRHIFTAVAVGVQ